MSWNPATYLTYADERTRPALELLARVPLDNPKLIADLGCGPGNSTGPLVARWPNAEVEGIDSSPEMIEAAKKSGVRARWSLADVATWSPPDTSTIRQSPRSNSCASSKAAACGLVTGEDRRRPAAR